MGTIVPFLMDKSFTPEAIEMMSQAFSKAKGFFPNADIASIEILAMRIITITSTGEHDSDKVAAAALASFCAGPPPADRSVKL